jgi:hypothetical protein
MGPETLVLGGRFKVLRHIGGGGMSEVYLAVQLSLGRQVALKVLKRDLGKRPDMAERFRREALLLSSVDHPAVVRVIDFEPTPEATVLVLELAEGDTLEAVLKSGPMPPARAIPILTQLGEGLGAIHEKGIIHRDLKPQNVVLTQTPRGEQARLLDFGIARLMEMGEVDLNQLPGLSENPMISHPGQVVGTPAFVAPEQATGKPLDARTDVYAFGVLAFRLLSGQFPFPGPGSSDFLKQHTTMAPKRLDEVVPSLADQPKLVGLVMQCLEKNPALRPASAHALYDRLVEVWPQSPHDSSVTTPSRRLLAPLVATPVPAPPPSDDAALNWQKAQAKAAAATQVLLERASQGMRAAHGAARGLSAEWKQSLLVAFGLLMLAPAVWAMLPPGPAEVAAKLLEQGRAEGALSLINEQLSEATYEAPELYSLKAAALHQVHRESEERETLRLNPYQSLQSPHPLLLDALAEDFGREEGDVELKALIKVVPEELLEPHFDRLSREAGSERQWGALRWLDARRRREDAEGLGTRYIASLNARDCRIRGAAARRLAELGVKDAIDALRALSETPKEKTGAGLINCGEDEAAEAIRELKREG